jgi:hypothetical protein
VPPRLSRPAAAPARDRHRLALRAEQVAVRHDAFEVVQHVGAVVDEVRDVQLPAVVGLLRPLQAEAQVVGRHAGALEEAVVPKPCAALGLHAGPAFRHQPHAAFELVDQRRHGVEHAVVGRRVERVAAASRR